jgi:small redox-active disulfide protein 2
MTEVKVYGPGCRRCDAIAAMVEETARRLEVDVTLERVTSPMEIARAGVYSTPGLAVNGRLMHMGGLPDAGQLAEWLKTVSPAGASVTEPVPPQSM